MFTIAFHSFLSLSRMNHLIHLFSVFLKYTLILYSPHTPRSSNKPCVLSFPAKILNTLLSHTCNIPHPSHSLRFGHTNEVWSAVQIIKLLLTQSSPLACHIVSCSHTPSPYVLPLSPHTKLHTHTKPQATLYLHIHA